MVGVPTVVGIDIMKRSVVTTPSDFKDWCSNLKSIWAFDCETNSLNYLDLEIIGWSICDGTQVCYVDIYPRYKKELLMILDFYLGEAKMVVFHSAPYDMMALKKEGIEI